MLAIWTSLNNLLFGKEIHRPKHVHTVLNCMLVEMCARLMAQIAAA